MLFWVGSATRLLKKVQLDKGEISTTPKMNTAKDFKVNHFLFIDPSAV
jgi:hypothetical protein